MAYYAKINNGYLLRVRLSPNSSCCRVCGLIENEHGDEYLKVSVTAVPEKGKANKDLIAFLSEKLGIAKSCLTVEAGQTDRWKKIVIDTVQNLDEKLEGLENGSDS